jgi:hypothetical protein
MHTHSHTITQGTDALVRFWQAVCKRWVGGGGGGRSIHFGLACVCGWIHTHVCVWMDCVMCAPAHRHIPTQTHARASARRTCHGLAATSNLLFIFGGAGPGGGPSRPRVSVTWIEPSVPTRRACRHLVSESPTNSLSRCENVVEMHTQARWSI